MTKTSVIIPYFNHWDLVHSRLAEFYKFIWNKYDIEIILINDASTELDCVTGVKFWQGVFNKEKKILRYHENKENGGFGYSMNTGMRLAKGDIFILYSNDVIMLGDWLGCTIEKLGDSHQKVLLGGEVVNSPAGWNEVSVGQHNVYFPYANGWLLAFRRELFDSGIKFDVTAFKRFDYEDVDLSTQAREVGYNLIALNSPFLKHMGGATIYSLGIDRQAITRKNRELFIAKWQDKFLKLGIRYD